MSDSVKTSAQNVKTTITSETSSGPQLTSTQQRQFSNGMEFEHDYKSTITPRETFSRKSMTTTSTGGGGGGRVLKIVTEMGSSSVTGMSPAFSANAASAILESREREKKEMIELNDRLANYIEKVRFLEAQNRKLAADLEALRGRWGKDTSSIKTMFEGELSEARRLIDETAKNKAEIEVQIARLQEDLAEYKRKWVITACYSVSSSLATNWFWATPTSMTQPQFNIETDSDPLLYYSLRILC